MSNEMIRVDFGEPSLEGCCLDCLVAMPLAVDKMRNSENPLNIINLMQSRTRDAFSKDSASDSNDFKLIASSSQDLLYRYIVQLKIIDLHTRFYIDQVVRKFFMYLSNKRLNTFYILDNSLREDRFNALLELFSLAGISVVTPRRDGMDWDVLQKRLIEMLSTHGHVAYIEPDNQVNHLLAALNLAKQLPCVATFRNLAPEDAQLEIVSLRVDSAK